MGIRKVLVANRGEIAVRIIRTARRLGIESVAVFSKADADSPHVNAADEAVALGAAAAHASYLAIPKIIAAAEKTGADALHPGYGFLAENPELAHACDRAGIAFVGPRPDAMALMGNKHAARQRMSEAGIPVVPGYHGKDQSDARLAREAARIGAPVMVKAAAGGGGRGMRLVDDLSDLAAALRAARSEAMSGFGNAELILENALRHVRHVEVQVFADAHGNVVHLGERDCSIQRRHQKVIEEAPSPVVSPELREKMGETACRAARAIKYLGAGTVEFLLAEGGEFYFLEMNTRLQVEHAVTEMITGLDLVAWQFAVAEGKPLPSRQTDIEFSGHAIEARLYAEDAERDFQPQTGRVALWEPAWGEKLRTDHALVEGQQITAYYDPMVAKIIAHGGDRQEALRRLRRAISETLFLGPTSNKGFLMQVLDHDAFQTGTVDTDFVATYFSGNEAQGDAVDPETVATAALVLFLQVQREADPLTIAHGPMAWPVEVCLGNRVIPCTVTVSGGNYKIRVEDGEPHGVADVEVIRHTVSCTLSGVRRRMAVAATSDRTQIDLGDRVVAVSRPGKRRATHETGGDDAEIRSSMSGQIVEILVEPGQRVRKGQAVVVLEAMKMHYHMKAQRDGVASAVRVAPGQQVGPDTVLVSLTANEPGDESPRALNERGR